MPLKRFSKPKSQATNARGKKSASNSFRMGEGGFSVSSEERNTERLKQLLDTKTILQSFTGEGAAEKRKAIVLKRKRYMANYKRPTINLRTDPLVPKIMEFYKKNPSTNFDSKNSFLKAFSDKTGIKVSTAMDVLQALIKAGRVSNFGRINAGRQLGVSNKEFTKQRVNEDKKRIAINTKAKTSPLYIPARKFGNKILIDAYKEELTKSNPSKERLTEIETVFTALNPTFNLSWLKEKARGK